MTHDTEPLRIALSSRFAWPAVGGTEALVRTAAAGLVARGHHVDCYAHRIDERLDWRGPLDRAAPFAPQRDPETGVLTHQLRLSAAEVAAVAPLLVLGRRFPQRVLRRLRLTAPPEIQHAWVAGRAFARRYAGAGVVHRFNGNRMALATVRAARRLGVPAVITPLAHPGQWDDDPTSARAYRGADLVVATSRADAGTYLGLGVDPDRVRVCPLPSAPVAAAAEAPPGFPDEHPVVLFLGARRAYKGVTELLAAAERLPRARFAFVGPGVPLPRPVPANVLDVGEVPAAERDAWLTRAAVLCLPSAAESFGLVVSEAWSAGVPVVTSDIPVLAERVAESGGGLAVPTDPGALAAALATLLDDEALRRRMGEAGRAHWRRTGSPEAYAAWHEAAYRELVDSRPGSRRPPQARP